MNGIAVYGIDIAFLMVIENAVANERSGADDVLRMLVYSNPAGDNCRTLFVMI